MMYVYLYRVGKQLFRYQWKYSSRQLCAHRGKENIALETKQWKLLFLSKPVSLVWISLVFTSSICHSVLHTYQTIDACCCTSATKLLILLCQHIYNSCLRTAFVSALIQASSKYLMCSNICVLVLHKRIVSLS